jgi:hypothetical protein
MSSEISIDTEDYERRFREVNFQEACRQPREPAKMRCSDKIILTRQPWGKR